mmetsp:Transcript_42931/g.135473  ORF Transcript_42931/g.135473 Transcript_42931/m.135473 type:complete len:288 (-) Transcript_42931:2953-3816(-)
MDGGKEDSKSRLLSCDTMQGHDDTSQLTVIEEVQHKIFSSNSSAVEDVANPEVERLGRMMIPHLLEILRYDATSVAGQEEGNAEKEESESERERENEVSVSLVVSYSQSSAMPSILKVSLLQHKGPNQGKDGHSQTLLSSSLPSALAPAPLQSGGKDYHPSPRSPRSPQSAHLSPSRQRPGVSPRHARPASWGLRHEIDLQRNGSLLDFQAGSEVPTLRSAQLVHPGSSVTWRIKLTSIGRKFASRFGVIAHDLKAKTDWWLLSSPSLVITLGVAGVRTRAVAGPGT